MTNWFQSDECLSFYKSLSFVEPFECAVKRDGVVKGRIVGYVQKDGGRVKQFLSRRAIINGGPMLAEDISEAELASLLDSCHHQLIGKAIYVETRNFADYGHYRTVFEECGWRYEPHYNYQVEIKHGEHTFDKMSENHRRSVRSSLKKGAEINCDPSLSEVHDFYGLLTELYETKVRTPLAPESFFTCLASAGRIILVMFEGRVIGGIAMAEQKSKCCYEWYVCGNDKQFKQLHPSTLATYAGMKYAEDTGCEMFDFMGAGAPGDGGYGVRDFKAKFGGELVEHGRFKYVLNPFLYKLGTFGVKILKRLK